MIGTRHSRPWDAEDGAMPSVRLAPAYGNGGTLGRRLRSLAAGAMLGLAAIGGTGAAALADDGSASPVQAPAAGMSVQVAEAGGTAQLTVYGMKDTGVATETENGPGRFVLVDLKIQNAGDTPFLFNTMRVRMHDDAGRAFTRVRFDNDDDPGLANFRQLRGQEIDDDDQARGWLAFAVDDDSTLRTISYRDDDGDDVGIADLTVASIRLDDDDDWDDDGRNDDDGVNNAVAGTGGGGGDDDDDDGFDDDGGGTVGGGAVGGGYAGDDDGYYGDDDGYYGDDGGGAVAGGDDGYYGDDDGYYGGDDDGWDDDDGGYYGGDDDWDDDGGDDDWDDGGDDDDGDDD